MKPMFLSLLMIFFINEYVQAAEDGEMDTSEYFPLSFANKLTILNWDWKLYNAVNELLTKNDLSREKTKEIHKEVKNLVLELDNLENNMDISAMKPFLPKEYEILESRYMKLVDNYYDQVVKFGFCERNSAKPQAFFQQLTSGPQNLQQILLDMHQHLLAAIRPGRLLDWGANVPLDTEQPSSCIEDISPRHKLYFIYTQVILTEMKGFATSLQAHARKVSVDGPPGLNYSGEMSLVKENFEFRLDSFHTMFTEDIGLLPQVIFRCPISTPKRGSNYVEVQHFSQIKLLNLLTDLLPRTQRAIFDPDKLQHFPNSEFYDNSPPPPGTCGTCESRIVQAFWKNGVTVHDCQSVGTYMKVCPPVPGSNREYLWLEDQIQNSVYGVETPCDLPYYVFAQSTASGIDCPLCACSVDLNITKEEDSNAIWRVSVTEQIADIWNDMVVTGVKFVTYDNAVHLQIQQAKFSDDALSSSGVAWKELDVDYSCSGKASADMKYEPLRFDQKILYLDDIKVPDGHVVTGVRFAYDDSAFMLNVHATPFDLETAELDHSKSTWLDAQNNPVDDYVYQYPRAEINMGEADDPSQTVQNVYDSSSNKAIKFTHTDFKKDAGQTTIPLLDAQPVEEKLPFPLSGIGLFFRGEVGNSGYVVPRTYTMDILPYMNMKVEHEEFPIE